MGTEVVKARSDGVLEEMRQLWFPEEFRIEAPPPVRAAEPPPSRPVPEAEQIPSPLVASFATCLWYLKTKFFRRVWDDTDNDDDDPRVRRALGRLQRSIEALERAGVELHDPTNERYPPGGEGLMKPIQFLPTDGIESEVVSQTIVPIVYRKNRLIQRGEVFVSVPEERD